MKKFTKNYFKKYTKIRSGNIICHTKLKKARIKGGSAQTVGKLKTLKWKKKKKKDV